mmetsp:Transcript_4343/g.12494  ORF Transcript_4343/g.12494 Transcript_4343/m.12494 type:complete len:87 (+) Transcript_4343:926-1186(+)
MNKEQRVTQTRWVAGRNQTKSSTIASRKSESNRHGKHTASCLVAMTCPVMQSQGNTNTKTKIKVFKCSANASYKNKYSPLLTAGTD